jgi:DNA (cytosine-5)-methyltransferase 1
MNYYNEWDRFAAAWLRNLITAGLLPDGDVDERSITDVQPSDLTGYTQCHFFAGIGGWALALQLAGWPSDAPIFTGSCPCQPFSTAGKHGGTDDARHLWPEFRRLIAVCQPPVVIGEQVASLDGRGWLAGVRVDLESMDYAVGSADLCAASVGAPHIRSRLWWVADTAGERRQQESRGTFGDEGQDGGESHEDNLSASHGKGERVAESGMARWPQASTRPALHSGNQPEPRRSAVDSGMADAERSGRMDTAAHDREHAAAGRSERDAAHNERQSRQGRGDEGASSGFWDNAESIPCLDGKSRRVEPGVAPLVDGFPGRVGQLRAYGNAISPQVAATFITAYLSVSDGVAIR